MPYKTQENFNKRIKEWQARKGYFIKDCRSRGTNTAKGTSMPEDDDRVKGTRKCSIRYFTFYYNNACRIYKDTKYGASYQL